MAGSRSTARKTVAKKGESRFSRGISLTIPVRWGDMDALGHVNNTLYFRYCESARIAYLEAMGIDLHGRIGRVGPGLVAASVNFLRQVWYPATLIVTASVTALTKRSITYAHLLTDAADGTKVADGAAVCVWMDYQKERALPIPGALVEAITRIEGRPVVRRRKRTSKGRSH